MTIANSYPMCTRGIMRVLQLDCKTQLMERDALNQQHVGQCYVRPIITCCRVLLVIGKLLGTWLGNYRYNSDPCFCCS